MFKTRKGEKIVDSVQCFQINIPEKEHNFYENNNYSSKKPSYNNRKESVQSTDSGLSDNSYASSYSSASSRKTSNVSATSASALSNLSITEEDSEVCIP